VFYRRASVDHRLGDVRVFLAARVAAGPVDAREASALRRFAAELDALARPFDRYAAPVHVTASAIVTGPRGVLLHRHKRLGLWLQPGGHIDPDEEPVDAALREVTEETGVAGRLWSSSPVHVDVHGGGLGHVHLDLRWLIAADGEPAPGRGESPEVRWFGWDEAMALAEAGLCGALSALRPRGPQRRRGVTGDGRAE
jgi:8-oxo-dGTP pyrophosphatase MutT (NUDIX family)